MAYPGNTEAATSQSLKCTTLALAILLAVATPLHAQSLTGGLHGQEPLGNAAHITISNPATGFEKTITPDADGRFFIDGLNPGNYQVSLSRGDARVASHEVVVRPNQNTAVATFDMASTQAAAGVQQLQTVQVSAMAMTSTVNPIDVSTPELASSFSAKLIDKLPMNRSMESVARLNSNVRHDDKTTGHVSMGGASPAENRYYYNEFDVSNDKTSLGATSLPAEAIANTQIISGGGTAAWTNATGGILSSTIKQGSNQFQSGYSLYYTPPTSKLFNPHARNSFDAKGQYYNYVADDRQGASSTEYFWASGPALRDKLFYYVLLGDTLPYSTQGYGQTQQAVSGTHNRNALVNLTWNLTENQSFNLLAHRDWDKTYTNYYSLGEQYNPHSVGDWYAWKGSVTENRFLIGNYHWWISDTLSLRLMGGYLGSLVSQPSSAYENADYPYVTSYDSATQKQTNIGRNNAYQIYSPSDYWRRGYKGDLSWQLGDHRVVLGGEYYRHALASTTESVPAGWYTYYNRPSTVVLPNGAVSPADGKYVSQYVNIEGGAFSTRNRGAYLEDYWQAADNLMLYGALRWDKYIYKDGNGNDFMDLSMTSPRLGFSWDVNGDSSLKVGGSAGKYTIPLPSSFSFGVAEARTTYTSYYTYTGVNPDTKAPTGLTRIGAPYVEYSGTPTPDSIAANNTKAPYQYEASLYVQKQLDNNWMSQVEGGWTELKRVIEDTCAGTAVTAYAHSTGHAGYTEGKGCWLVNPGEDMTLVRDYDGDGRLQALQIPAAALGLPKPEHKYYHLTATFSHAATPDEPYFLNVSYTWAREYGNTNGLLDEERRNGGWIGQTTAFNYPGIMEGSTGNLAGDIRHSLVVSGNYDFSNGLSLGGIFNAHTGAPTSCLGTYPDASNPAYPEGAATHYCNNHLANQGHGGRLPFFWQLDLSSTYHWKWGQKNALSLQLIVQNLTNRKGVIDRNQAYDTGSLDSNGEPTASFAYHAVTYQDPRSTTLVFRYQFQ